MAKRLQLIRAWLTVNRGELGAVLLGLALLAGLFVVSIRTHGFATSSAALGPDWDCMELPKGEPICVRKFAPPSPHSR